jgi:hypothetical protein
VTDPASDPTSDPAPDPAASSGPRWRTVALVVALVLTALPLVVLAVQVLAHPRGAPLGDQALIELRVRDVGSAHTPLVGSYQKFGWNQPGPAFLYLLAAPYRAFGADYAALQVGAVLLNALGVAGIVVVAVRRGGVVVALWTMALLGLLFAGRGANVFASPWEPSVSVVALVLLTLVVTDLALGRAWMMPVAAALATVIAQAWATTTVMAAVLLGWGLVAFALRRRVALTTASGPAPVPEPGAWRRPALVSSAVLVVLWLPPLVEQLRDHPGNVTDMWRFFTASHTTFGLVPAYRAVAIELGVRAPWLGFTLPTRPFQPVVNEQAGALVPIALVALLVGGVVAVRRRDQSVALAVTVALLVVAGVLALSRLIGEPFVEVLEPAAAYGFACWLAAGWCLIASTRGRTRARVDAVLLPVLTLAVVVLGVHNVAIATDAPKPVTNDERAVQVLADRAVPAARRVDGPVLVRSDLRGNDILLGEIGPQLLALTLDRAGVDVRVAADRAHQYGAFRAHPDQARAEVLLSYAATAPEGDGWRRVAVVDPLSPAQRARRDRLDARLDAALGGITDPAARLAALHDRPELAAIARARDAITGLDPLAVSVRSLDPANP